MGYSEKHGTTFEDLRFRPILKFKGFEWHFINWDHIQFGFHICLGLQKGSAPSIELHVPFGFLWFGWDYEFERINA